MPKAEASSREILSGHTLHAVAFTVILVSYYPPLHFVLCDAGFNDLVRPAMYGGHHAISVIACTNADVRAELAQRTGLPVIVDNDVRVLAFAEARLGAGRPFGKVLHVSVGTGVGGALTESGRLVHGKRDSAGEIAHLLVPERSARAPG